MFWESLALIFVGSALDAIFGGRNGISETDLRSALRDAVNDIKKEIREAILEDRLNQLTARIDALQMILREYVHNNDPALLQNATTESAVIGSELKYLAFPDYPLLFGLPGHTLFMVAASLRSKILEKRIEVFGAEEVSPLQDYLDDSINHAVAMHIMWDQFNWARYIGPFPKLENPGIPVIRFCYKFDSQTKPTPYYAVLNSPADYESAMQNAIVFINEEREKTWQELQTSIVNPSEQVVHSWNNLRRSRFSRPLNLETIVTRGWDRIELVTGVKMSHHVTGIAGSRPATPRRPGAPVPG